MEEEESVLKCDVRKIEKSAIALDISVPKKVADEIHLKTLAKLAKSAKIPGFRGMARCRLRHSSLRSACKR